MTAISKHVQDGTAPLRHASCSCGQLKATVTGHPLRVSICHCLNCQRRTGSPFSEQARFRRGDVEVAGPSTVFVLVGDEGGRAHFHFCPQCGATVYYIVESMQEFISIPVGVFADPSFPTPQVSVYENRMHHWVRVPDHIEHM